MKSLEKGQDKIQKICDALKQETLEPAQKEALQIIETAKTKAEALIHEAEKKAAQIVEAGRHQVEQERKVFQASMNQGAKQALESLRQSIEYKLFDDELFTVLQKQMANPQVIAQLINCIINAIEKAGISANLAAIIPKEVPSKEVALLLLKNVIEKLQNETLHIGDFEGGAQVKIKDKKMTLDISNLALKELLASYVRKDFRKMIFGE